MIFALLIIGAPSFALVIGNNQAPDGMLDLQYADDDAATMAELFESLGADVTLLSVLDADTQERHPHWAARARAPTLAHVRSAVKTEAREVFLYFSGHGVIADGEPALVLSDGALTRAMLIDELLSGWPNAIVHVILDACHAAELVQARGQLARVAVAHSERERILDARALDKFPNVGVLVASSSTQETHEWSRYRRGVFTYLLQSAMRGAADADGDGRVGYLEASAFAAAATRGIADARARPRIVALAPKLDLRAPLAAWTEATPALLVRGSDERVTIEDARGVAIASLHLEAGHEARLRVPAGDHFRVVDERPLGQLTSRITRLLTGRVLAEAVLVEGSAAREGAVASPLYAGFLEVPFGPAYFRGYSDPIALSVEKAPFISDPRRTRASAALWSAGAVALTVGLVFAGLAGSAASEYDATLLERRADDAASRYALFGVSALVSSGVALALAASGLAVFDWPR